MASTNSHGSPSEASDDQHRFRVTFASPSFTPTASDAYPISMIKGNDENIIEVAELTDTSTGEKRKRPEGKVRSIVWDHFEKLIKEDGTCEKCRCIHCNKLFACTSRCGTTHLLRHLSKNHKTLTNTSFSSISDNNNPKGNTIPWKCDQPPVHPPIDDTIDVNNNILEGFEDLDHRTSEYAKLPQQNGTSEYAKLPQQNGTSEYAKLPQQNAVQPQPGLDAKMNEVKGCANKLVKLLNELPNGVPLKACSTVASPDYSLTAAIKCLNVMGDIIPESSTVYLDALDIIRDPVERECFLCLNPEPRRRWLRRMLHRCYPMRYSSDV